MTARVGSSDLAGRIWFNTSQAAEYTGWSYDTVVRALREGTLQGQQRGAGKHWRIHRDALDAWNGGGVA